MIWLSMRLRGKRASERRIKGWKAEWEISDEEIESIFSVKKRERNIEKTSEKRNKRTYIIDYNRSFQQVWMDILHSG